MRTISPNIPLENLDGLLDCAVRKHSDQIIEKLCNLMQQPLEASVEDVEFSAHIPFELAGGHPNIWFYLNGKNKLVGSNIPGYYAGNSWNFYTPTDIPCFDGSNQVRFDDYGYPNAIADIILKWFAECWWKAGGWFYDVPAKINAAEDAGYVGFIQLTRTIKS